MSKEEIFLLKENRAVLRLSPAVEYFWVLIFDTKNNENSNPPQKQTLIKRISSAVEATQSLPFIVNATSAFNRGDF